MAESKKMTALSGLQIVERSGGRSTDLGQIAVAFAGLLASRFGARVMRAVDPYNDPISDWPPLLPDGSSALYRFLNHSKEFTEGDSDCSYVLTDDESIVAAGPPHRTIHIRIGLDISADRHFQSELTMQAIAGLLHTAGNGDDLPLPLPGHQCAYAAGICAFNALLASRLSEIFHGRSLSGEVGIAETAAWVNWKRRLKSQAGRSEAEVPEEWVVMECRDGFVAIVFRDADIGSLTELIGDQRLAAPEFAQASSRIERLGAFHGIIGEALAGRAQAEIASEAARLKLPIAPVLSLFDLAADEQISSRGFLTEALGLKYAELPLKWRQAPAHHHPTRAEARHEGS